MRKIFVWNPIKKEDIQMEECLEYHSSLGRWEIAPGKTLDSKGVCYSFKNLPWKTYAPKSTVGLIVARVNQRGMKKMVVCSYTKTVKGFGWNDIKSKEVFTTKQIELWHPLPKI